MDNKFEIMDLSAMDFDEIRDMVETVDEEGIASVTKILGDSKIQCKVYSMGENNPIIRIDLKRRAIIYGQ